MWCSSNWPKSAVILVSKLWYLQALQVGSGTGWSELANSLGWHHVWSSGETQAGAQRQSPESCQGISAYYVVPFVNVFFSARFCFTLCIYSCGLLIHRIPKLYDPLVSHTCSSGILLAIWKMFRTWCEKQFVSVFSCHVVQIFVPMLTKWHNNMHLM